MKREVLIVGLVIVAFALLGTLVYINKKVHAPDNTDVLSVSDVELAVYEPSHGNSNYAGSNSTGNSARNYNVEITSSGFSPDAIQISKGDSVTFLNKGDSESWPEAIGVDSSSCGTSDEKYILDSCKKLPVGKSYIFVFGGIGNWKYHDRLNPKNTGTIAVK